MLKPIADIGRGERMKVKQLIDENPMIKGLLNNMQSVEESIRRDFILSVDDDLTKYCLQIFKDHKKETKMFLEETENDVKEIIEFTKVGMYSPVRLAMGQVIPSSPLYHGPNDTCYHQMSSMLLALKIGRDLGLSTEEQRNLAIGMANHDIGKYLLLDLVNKPEKLEGSEMALMSLHPEIGHAIIKSSDYEMSERSLDIVLSHHERRDGKGYPNGIKELAPLTEIAAVADMFDALIDKRRPYRDKPFTLRESLDIIIADADDGKLNNVVVESLVALNRGSKSMNGGYYPKGEYKLNS